MKAFIFLLCFVVRTQYLLNLSTSRDSFFHPLGLTNQEELLTLLSTCILTLCPFPYPHWLSLSSGHHLLWLERLPQLPTSVLPLFNLFSALQPEWEINLCCYIPLRFGAHLSLQQNLTLADWHLTCCSSADVPRSQLRPFPPLFFPGPNSYSAFRSQFRCHFRWKASPDPHF